MTCQMSKMRHVAPLYALGAETGRVCSTHTIKCNQFGSRTLNGSNPGPRSLPVSLTGRLLPSLGMLLWVENWKLEGG